MHIFTNRFLHIISTVLLVSLLIAPLPFQAGVGSASAFSVGEEREVGEKLLTLIRREFKLLDDPDFVQYVNTLGKEILSSAGPQYFHYHFFVIENREFNAFAAPSGLIFLHSGLIDICRTEGELYSVLAHEVGHVASRHIASRIDKASKINIGTAALLIAGIALGGGAVSEALIAGSQAAGAHMQLQFSRHDEEEADRLAYIWMKAQKRDPAEMVDMLQKMRRVSRYRRSRVPQYLLTHPEPENRISYVSDLLAIDKNIEFKPRDDFEFQRIRYRIQSLTKKTTSLLPIYMKKVNDDAAPERERIMARYGLSQAYLATRNFTKARESLKQLMLHYPDKPILKTDLGITYFQNGEYDEALKLFKAAKAKNPDCLYTAYYYATTLHKMGNPNEAIILYENLLAKLPDYPKLYYQIGEIKTALGDKEAGQYNLGVYFWLEGDVKTARFHLGQVVQTLPVGHATRVKAEQMLAEIERLEKI